MMRFAVAPEIDKNKAFLVPSSDLEGRLDPHYYRPFFRANVLKLNRVNSAKLGTIVDFSNEIWDQKRIFSAIFPYIEIGAIDLLSGEINKIDEIKTNNAPSRAKMIVRNDDILISTTRPGRGAITHIQNEGIYIASTGFSIIRKVNNTVSRRYLFHWLRQPRSLLQMEQRSSGGNYPAITQEELAKVKIPVPPEAIQARIVTKMDAAYADKKQKEAEAQQLVDSIDDYLSCELGIALPKQGENTIASRMFTRQLSDISGGRFDPFFSSLNKQDESGKYKRYRLRELADISKGNSITRDKITESKIPVIAGGVEPAYYHNESNRSGNVITIGASGSAGYVAYHTAPIFASDCITIQSNDEKRAKTQYISYILQYKQDDLYALAYGAIQQHVYPDDIKNISIPVPPLKKQTEITDHIANIHNQARQLQQQAKRDLEQAKKEMEAMILGEDKRML